MKLPNNSEGVPFSGIGSCAGTCSTLGTKMELSRDQNGALLRRCWLLCVRVILPVLQSHAGAWLLSSPASSQAPSPIPLRLRRHFLLAGLATVSTSHPTAMHRHALILPALQSRTQPRLRGLRRLLARCSAAARPLVAQVTVTLLKASVFATLCEI